MHVAPVSARRWRRGLLPFLAAAALTLAAMLLGDAKAEEAAGAADAVFADMVRGAIEGHLRPVHDRFASAATRLDETVTVFCADPAAAGLPAVEAAFAETARAFGALEPVRYGPLVEENRRERLAFWPDPRGLGLRQVQAALATEDPTATDPVSLAGKSVAVQGLTALEYLLHGTGRETLAEPGAYRCRFAAAIAANVASIAAEMRASWAPDGKAARLFLDPGADNPLFLDHAEAAAEILSGTVTALEVIADQKLGPPLGSEAARARPKLAPLWRSGLVFPPIVETLGSVRDVLAASGVAARLPPDKAWVAGQIRFELDAAVNTAEALDAPMQAVATDPQLRGRADYLRLTVASLKSTIARDLMGALGLAQGFNALDGD